MPRRSIEVEDLLRFQVAGTSRISPDGDRIVFPVQRIDCEKNRYLTRLWMVDADAGTARAFTGDGHGDGSPVWSPDGARIAFVSDRDSPGSQLYLIPAGGGEAERLTHLDEGGIQSPAWSPDGRRIAFLYRATPEGLRDSAKKEREEKGLSEPVRVHTRLAYRLDGFGYFDDSQWQIAIADAATGETRVLTEGPHSFGAPDWSPDGALLATLSNRRDDSDLEPQRDEIWVVPAEGGDPRRVPAPDGPKHGIAWSPNGEWLAYVGHCDPEETWGTKNDRVLVVPAAGSETAKDLTGWSDKTVGYLCLSDLRGPGGGPTIVWSADSHSLFAPISERGDTRLYRVSMEAEGMEPLTPEGHEMGGFTVSRDGDRIALLLGTAVDLHDVFVADASGAEFNPRRLTRINESTFSDLEFRAPEPFHLPNQDGGSVHGWVLAPPDREPGRLYPAIVYIHGGPSLQYGGSSTPFFEFQWLAACGYVVVFANPRGSKGYGEAHTAAIRGNWGDLDFLDVEIATDYATELPYVDPDRIGLLGGSYGGYLTMWMLGHTDQYLCAVADRLVGNLHSMSGTTDFNWQHGRYFRGNAWDDPSDLWRLSPLRLSGFVKTPLLLIHSDGDLRCPIGQAEELFAALRSQRKTVEFVRYPSNSSHGMSRSGPPDLRLDRLRRIRGWLDRYLM